MDISKLPKTTLRPAKRVGRGIGSGKGGHTSGRGHKGQKAREKVPLTFEGTKMKKSLIKRLPMQRGKGRFKPSTKLEVINLRDLESWPEKKAVTEEALGRKVKILGGGEVKKALVIKVAISKKAAEKIKKAGGRMEV